MYTYFVHNPETFYNCSFTCALYIHIICLLSFHFYLCHCTVLISMQSIPGEHGSLVVRLSDSALSGGGEGLGVGVESQWHRVVSVSKTLVLVDTHEGVSLS